MGNVRPSEAAVEQRRQDILRAVIDRGDARIDELADRFGVSLMTMHRDLDDLAGRRLLKKLRGRVEAFPSLTMETATRFRVGWNTAEKEAIASAVIGEVQPGTTVFMEDSTTIFAVAQQITDVEDLTVVTNSVRLAQIVAGKVDEVVFLGGRYRNDFDSCTGPDVLRSLSRMRADLAFLSATTISEGRMYHPIQDYAEIKEAMCESSARSLMLIDHSKFGKTATYAHGDVSAYDLVVTDDKTPEYELEAMRALGTQVEVAPVSPPELSSLGYH